MLWRKRGFIKIVFLLLILQSHDSWQGQDTDQVSETHFLRLSFFECEFRRTGNCRLFFTSHVFIAMSHYPVFMLILHV